MNVILYSIPLFFLLIGIELVLEKARNTNFYRLNDAINSLSLGVLSQITGVLKRLVPLGIYVLVFDHVAMFELPDAPWVWVLAFVLYDLCYYWFHRCSHEINFFWAAHVVHHSSEEYNLTTALRQTSGSLIGWVFYLPLAVLGFEPIMIGTVGALNLVYQFWVHTRHVPKLGWFEWCFVSPSNHRVHHAQNDIYLDKNYGGVFIVWDRLFGSFQEELDNQPIIYGVRGGLNSWNPLWANLHVYSALLRDSWFTKGWFNKFRVWFKHPGWRPDDVQQQFPSSKVDLTQFHKFDVALSASTKWYCALQHLLNLLLGVMFLLSVARLETYALIACGIGVIGSCFLVGMMLEAKRWAVYLEAIKNMLLIALAATLPVPFWFAVLVAAICTISLLMLIKLGGDLKPHVV